MTKLLLPFLSIALAASAAAAPVPEEAKAPRLYWPTEVGTRLVYLRTESRRVQEETWEVTKVEDRAGGLLVTTEYVLEDGKRRRHQKALVTAAGASLVMDGGVTFDPPWRKLKLPPVRGDTWVGPELPGRPGPNGRVVVVGTETVVVPAGRFEAVVVEWHGLVSGGRPRYSYAPGVGLVRLSDADGEPVLALKAVHPPRGGP